MASENVVVVTVDNFDSEVLQSEVPVLVDFWAPWCGPCKMMSPVIDQLADEYVGKAKVVKVDIETNEETKQVALSHGVQGIPAFMMFSGGEKSAELVGGQSKPKLAELIDNALA